MCLFSLQVFKTRAHFERILKWEACKKRGRNTCTKYKKVVTLHRFSVDAGVTPIYLFEFQKNNKLITIQNV